MSTPCIPPAEKARRIAMVAEWNRQSCRWKGAAVEEVKAAWLSGEPRRIIAHRLGTSVSRLQKVAKVAGLPARKPGRRKRDQSGASA